MKTIILISAFVLFCFSSSWSQESKYERLHQFDQEAFSKRFEKSNENNFQNELKTSNDTTILSRTNETVMPVFLPKSNNYSMPNMSIRDDINYTMQIKKYDLCYPYVTQERIDSLLNLKKSKIIPLIPE